MILFALIGSLAWVPSDYKDPIDDHREVIASLSGSGVSLDLACTPRAKGPGVLRATVTAKQFLGTSGFAQVFYRFDELAAKGEFWNFAGRAVTNDERAWSDGFSAGLMSASKLTFRVIDSTGESMDIEFPLPADRTALARVRSACRYKTY